MTDLVDKFFCVSLIFIVFLSGFLLGLSERDRYKPKGPYDEFRPLNKPRNYRGGQVEVAPCRKPLPDPQKEEE